MFPSFFPCLQGETETDLSKEKLFNRALAGFHATIDAKLREAVEAGDEKEIETQHLAVTIKNVFGAPNPPDGTTGCGKDGEHCNSHCVPRNVYISCYKVS